MKKLHILTEAVFNRGPNNIVWSPDVHGFRHWKPYLSFFDKIVIVARINNVNVNGGLNQNIDDLRIEFCQLSPYRGLLEGLIKVPALLVSMWNESKFCNISLLRLPGPISAFWGIMVLVRNKPYACQIVGDGRQALRGPGFNVMHRIFGEINDVFLRYICKKSLASRYVTEKYLQNKYPPGLQTKTFSISDVELKWRSPVENRKKTNSRFLSDVHNISFCGSLEQMYKGLDVLIKSVSMLLNHGVTVVVNVAGDGMYRDYFEKLASLHGVHPSIRFHGFLKNDDVIDMFDHSDIFVMPSRTEGLPRAMIEAMARGLPCIGSSVGGIPELLRFDAIVPADDVVKLYEKILQFLTNKELLLIHANANYQKSKEYDAEISNKKRNDFLSVLKNSAK
jgi:glycosyltransferase involved in cell wall biosynthesis